MRSLWVGFGGRVYGTVGISALRPLRPAGPYTILACMETLDIRRARRLALARAGLLKPNWTGFPTRASGRGARARTACLDVIGRFGYLQLDTVSVAGARSHGIVLHSRLEGLDAGLAETLLRPDGALFEYWGHEASWMPMDLYPAFGFRRETFAHHPWWGDVVGRHPEVADGIRRRLREEGPLRSADLDGANRGGWWNLKVANRVVTGLWSSGEIAIRERVGFQRVYDLAERVIPDHVFGRSLPEGESLERLLLLALQGHGWAPTGTLVRTWRFRNRASAIRAALDRLRERGTIVPCRLADGRPGGGTAGWIRPADLELAGRLDRARPRRDRGVLLSPFDPLLWERPRVQTLFGFDMVLEIFKPAAQRVYGYYSLPVLAGEHLVARVDLKADRRAGVVRVLSCHVEGDRASWKLEAVRTALARFGRSVGLEPTGAPVDS